ncbi:hypothetical protein IJ425_04135 [bacterium]|nr:hypothetical protein [bacterium]
MQSAVSYEKFLTLSSKEKFNFLETFRKLIPSNCIGILADDEVIYDPVYQNMTLKEQRHIKNLFEKKRNKLSNDIINPIRDTLSIEYKGHTFFEEWRGLDSYNGSFCIVHEFDTEKYRNAIHI